MKFEVIRVSFRDKEEQTKWEKFSKLPVVNQNPWFEATWTEFDITNCNQDTLLKLLKGD